MEPLQTHPFRTIIFASGNGTNAERLSTYFADSDLVDVVGIWTNNPKAGVLQRAERLDIPTQVMARETYSDGEAMLKALEVAQADFIILAGYLKLVPAEVVRAYPKRILNIHPALLPKFGGKGMYGMRVHEAVIKANEAKSGITIHYVNERYDEGDVIRQAEVEVRKGMTAEELAAAIHELEYAHFPETIKALLREQRAT